jgi:uncharacterized membrane protein YukC
MTTIIMLISLPIGIYILFQEKEGMRKYQAVFDNFYGELQADNSLLKEEKLQLLQDMFYKNHYDVIQMQENSITAQKKLFSVGWLFVGIGTFYVGLIVYMLYYFYFQKPHVLVFEV